MVHTQMKSMTSPRAIRTNSPIYSHQYSSSGWQKTQRVSSACLVLRMEPPPQDKRGVKKPSPINGEKPFNFTSKSVVAHQTQLPLCFVTFPINPLMARCRKSIRLLDNILRCIA